MMLTMTLTRQLRKGVGSKVERLCAGLGSGPRAPVLSSPRLAAVCNLKSLLSLGLSSLLGKMGMLIAVPLTSQSGGEDWRTLWI